MKDIFLLTAKVTFIQLVLLSIVTAIATSVFYFYVKKRVEPAFKKAEILYKVVMEVLAIVAKIDRKAKE
jgi:ABC-type bacteriocin/lantibiotic exporter with double-glycine peptidase domain